MDTGDTVPDFAARLHDGRSVRLSELLSDGPAVLFFYPKAFTGGCTVQACHFRDLAGEFAEVGAQRIGVSRDTPDTQAKFGEEHDLDYPLVADEDGAIAKIFGAKRIGPVWSKRQTFVVDVDRTLLGSIASEKDIEVHADEALAILRASADA
jgi:thioredoxin-dependent peroxiredoxin